MNPMRKIFLVLVLLGLALGYNNLEAKAYTYDFPNATHIRVYDGGGDTPSSYGGQTWVDYLGNDFKSFGADLIYNPAGQTTLYLYTNKGPGLQGPSPGYGPADLFFDDFSTPQRWDVAIQVSLGESNSAQIYSLGTYNTSQNEVNTGGHRYGGLYDPTYSGGPIPDAQGQVVPTRITSGTVLDNNVTVDWQSGLTDAELKGAIYRLCISWDTADFDIKKGDVEFLWGSGVCANDTIGGRMETPIPPSAVLLGSGLLSLGLLGWRRRSKD
jgi:hypothetical protein